MIYLKRAVCIGVLGYVQRQYTQLDPYFDRMCDGFCFIIEEILPKDTLSLLCHDVPQVATEWLSGVF